MIPESCPRFDTCNASVCPLDAGWRKTVHLNGEKACYYLLNLAKAGADERFRDDPVAQEVAKVADEVQSAHPDIARRVAAAAKSGFQGGHLIGRGRNARTPLPTL